MSVNIYERDDFMKDLFLDFLKEFSVQVKSIKKYGIKKQIPNILTFSRALAPFIIVPTILIGRIDIAVLELVIFAITDFLDGKLARKYNCVSKFGIKLDAFCDKIFALGLMIPAIIYFPILIVNLALEICISYVNVISEVKHNNPCSIMVGKIKTSFLSLTLFLAYFPGINYEFILISSGITLGLQIVALVRYRNIDISKDLEKKSV